MKDPAIIVLEALLRGATIKVDGWKVRCEEATDGKPLLVYVATKIQGDEESEALLGCDMTVNEFMRVCRNMSEEDIICLSFSNAMAKMRKPRSKLSSGG